MKGTTIAIIIAVLSLAGRGWSQSIPEKIDSSNKDTVQIISLLKIPHLLMLNHLDTLKQTSRNAPFSVKSLYSINQSQPSHVKITYLPYDPTEYIQKFYTLLALVSLFNFVILIFVIAGVIEMKKSLHSKLSPLKEGQEGKTRKLTPKDAQPSQQNAESTKVKNSLTKKKASLTPRKGKILEFPTIELKLAPAVKRFTKCDKYPDLPEPLCEDATSLKIIKGKYIVGYLADAAPGRENVKLYDKRELSSRLHAKILGETFLAWWDKNNIEDIFNFPENRLRETFGHFLDNIFAKKIENLIDMESLKSSAEFQVSFTGFALDINTKKLILYHLGDTQVYVATEDGFLQRIPKIPAMFTRIDPKADERVSIYKQLRIFNYINIEGLLIASDGVMGDTQVAPSKSFCEFADSFREDTSNSEDDKSLLIINFRSCSNELPTD